MKKIQIKVPRDHRYVRTRENSCHKIVEAYAYPYMPPYTILVSEEGTILNYEYIADHSSRLIDLIDYVGRYPKANGKLCGVTLEGNFQGDLYDMTIVAKIDSRGRLRLLPEKEQKMVGEFKITEKQMEAFEEYRSKLGEKK